jgi:hypothetical protein
MKGSSCIASCDDQMDVGRVFGDMFVVYLLLGVIGCLEISLPSHSKLCLVMELTEMKKLLAFSVKSLFSLVAFFLGHSPNSISKTNSVIRSKNDLRFRPPPKDIVHIGL